jgi:P4 family phage/plasmid primase-like protien
VSTADTNGTGNRGRWRDASPRHPCPVCDHTSWCRISEDESVALCRHKDNGEPRTDKNGAVYYVHRLRESTNGERWQEPIFTTPGPRAEPATLDLVYKVLLARLRLSDTHRQALADRGLKADPIEMGYRTLPDRGRAAVVYELVRAGLEKHLPGVPGFYVGERKGRRYWTVGGPQGLLIPVRDLEGQIVALLVRRDKVEPKQGKYCYLSSRRHKKGWPGPSPGAPIHVPQGHRGEGPVRVTEGALKSDLATDLSGTLTIGLPGVNSWQRAAAILHRLRATVVRVAFDADAREKVQVADPLVMLVRLLRGRGFDVELETWDEDDGKGIDDLWKAGREPCVHRGDEALAEAERIQRQAAGRLAEPQEVEAPHLTDQGNAVRMVRCFGKDLHHCHPWCKDLVWDGRRWLVDDTGEAQRMAKRTVRRIYEEAAAELDPDRRAALAEHAVSSESARAISAMIRLARSEPGVPVLPADLDSDLWLLNVQNGTLDLRSGQLRPHRREDLLTKLCPTAFDPAAVCPLWERFLVDVFAGDGDVIGYVQRLCGYCLTGDVSEHLFPVFWGSGGNGKGTLLETARAVMGSDYGMAAKADFLLVRHGEHHPTELADLFGKRLVICQETGDGRRLNEPLMKWLTGGDRLRARRMREDAWEFTASHKLILVSNYKPEIRGMDIGLWRRLRLIPFTVTFEGERKDPRIGDRLRAEAPGILGWMVRGCLAWQRDGMGAPQSVQVATAEYREEQDAIGDFILEECVTGSQDLRGQASKLYQRFQIWCKRTGVKGGVADMSQKRFGMALAGRGFERLTSNGVWYLGLALREEESYESPFP